MKRFILCGIGGIAGLTSLYFGLIVIGFMNARDATYFTAHPDEHRRVLDDCRSGGGFFPECEAAEAVADDLN